MSDGWAGAVSVAYRISRTQANSPMRGPWKSVQMQSRDQEAAKGCSISRCGTAMPASFFSVSPASGTARTAWLHGPQVLMTGKSKHHKPSGQERPSPVKAGWRGSTSEIGDELDRQEPARAFEVGPSLAPRPRLPESRGVAAGNPLSLPARQAYS